MINVEELKLDSYDIVGVLHAVHRELGPGLNEYVYQEGLEMELRDHDFSFVREFSFHPCFRGRPMAAEYRLDFLCEENIIIECKSVQKLSQEHRAQLFNYMRLTQKPVGILVNFAPSYAEIERYFLDSEEQVIYDSNGNILFDLVKRR